MQNAREALELFGRRIRRAHLVRPGFVKHQLEPKWILQPAHKAPGGIGLLDGVTGHAGCGVVANVSIIRYGSLIGYRIGQVQPRSMYSCTLARTSAGVPVAEIFSTKSSGTYCMASCTCSRVAGQPRMVCTFLTMSS